MCTEERREDVVSVAFRWKFIRLEVTNGEEGNEAAHNLRIPTVI